MSTRPAARPLPSVQRQWLVLLLGLWAGLLLLAVHAQAAELPWRGRPFQIIANEKPLPDFLRELAASQGTTAVVDPKVAGVISGKFSGPALTILNSVCSTNGLTWYYDGAFLFIDLASEAKSEVLSIAGSKATAIAETLVRMRIADDRYPFSISEKQGSLYVSGPRRYVEMVRQAVKLVDQNQRAAQSEGAEIRMFPLRYAWAADLKITRSGKETVVPGVANVLRSLYGKGGSQQGGGGRGASAPFRVGPSRQLQLSTGETVNAPKVEMPSVNADDGNGLPSFGNAGELPQFQADSRMNAVLVRDLPDKMAQYERLIQSMDVRPRLIEIEVTIMDISTDTLTSLGVDWRLHGRHGDAQIGRGDRPPLTWNGATSEGGQIVSTGPNGVPTMPLGGVFTAAIGNDVRNYLLARVNALQTKGDANFVARPKVMTLDNTEAVLENLSEFFVRVDGFQDASLFSITAGTAVRVTPLVVDERNGRGVMLSIDIVDGNLSNEIVDRIPIVRRRTVNTQALVDEGNSLLIAGYSSEEKVNATSGVPVLSDLPIVGNLFKYNEKKQANMERFYLLTPRLVIPTSAVPAPATTPAPTPGPTSQLAPAQQAPVQLTPVPAPARAPTSPGGN
ncbi:type III secretion system outer membrane ring subunit SctC [Caldimonas brevitalea]|uniref:Type 3 secretion system secretin n=1 Tax=Caldimonas brevitalea TaxID=413882 RepID=A0A0G3BRM7_9BURK|nr:type III secretion system outer membrane ring subunit SctC [Caldimonas brevitalea]AKJ32084.1 general secretion pathway protein D [Caldimonas brevitalea]